LTTSSRAAPRRDPSICGGTADRIIDHSSSIHAEIPRTSGGFDDRMPLMLGYFVVAVLLPANVHFRMGEPCLGVHLERRKRVGNRRGGDVRRLSVCWFRWPAWLRIALWPSA